MAHDTQVSVVLVVLTKLLEVTDIYLYCCVQFTLQKPAIALYFLCSHTQLDVVINKSGYNCVSSHTYLRLQVKKTSLYNSKDTLLFNFFFELEVN